MTQDIQNSKHFIADRGKVFKRTSDGFIFGNELYLGYAYYIDGIKLDTPIEEQIEDFEEVLDIDNDVDII